MAKRQTFLTKHMYRHNRLISLVMAYRPRKPLKHTDVRRREIWEWSDHTRFAETLMEEQVHRVEQKWQRKWNEIKEAA